jgi:hypothetical protein
MSTPAPVLSTANQVKVQQVYCSVLNSDLSKCKQQLDTLDPQNKIRTVRTAETQFASNFETETNEQRNVTVASIQDSLDHLDKILTSNSSLEKQVAELTAQKKALDTENQSMEQSIRAHRRRFLDNDPQEGTPSFLGFRTSDDKVLLFFWLALVVLVNLAIYTYFAVMRKNHIPIVYIGITVGIALIAYMSLYYSTRIEYKLRSTTL